MIAPIGCCPNTNLFAVGAGLGGPAELMLGYGNMRRSRQRIDERFDSVHRYGVRTFTGARMPSPHLHRKLVESLGDDAGEELAAVIDRVDPIRADIAELRHAMEVLIEKSAKEQMRFMFLAWAVLLAAIVGLYAR